ncbi:MAG: M4 family metallopeptidase [Acidobacteria bacterium]|nr:M4 family metallopeptidase [Acidobacteriota bacterium]
MSEIDTRSIGHPRCCIIPPIILRNLAEKGDDKQRDLAFDGLQISAGIRGKREAMGSFAFAAAIPAGEKRRTIYDAQNRRFLPGKLVRGEGGPKSKDVMVNEAYVGSGKTYDFFMKVYGRNSIDDRGLRLDSTVHYGRMYMNAFWDGQQMVYGDGDGRIFERFTRSLDIIGHELAHGVTQYEADLIYEDEPGALNEHFSDVFGALVKQYARKQTAEKADWLIGKGIFSKGVKGVALRSMKAPGAAFNDPLIGKDPQPGHMDNFVKTRDDNGGVHINSGIPNKAFYELAVRLKGFAWERAGRIWYVTLRDRLRSDSVFQDCADATFDVARELYGADSVEQRAVREAWDAVGIKTGEIAARKAKAAGAGLLQLKVRSSGYKRSNVF